MIYRRAFQVFYLSPVGPPETCSQNDRERGSKGGTRREGATARSRPFLPPEPRRNCLGERAKSRWQVRHRLFHEKDVYFFVSPW